ncbi:gamma-glutamyl-gamma-aminobutyrate hydrolase family protein [Deinococcus peraridilitoris]|uniref:Putative glutamine amidotransferase n=1 Tax=Deinococcus peraridilitoris (strain DSM 19664 / LMG 22246 / CIP 109416 / KR-200) TaxID=937777 RepID=L0A098_DEIPD|nr:gamma-glutamyl-gamma-aminobutyrate hydrolase family protein [Deinococcus peraridilitoris]AFZ67266.1 putative glutamine amidotransferase [Deinococcus peraridilitoris DSM 19664]
MTRPRIGISIGQLLTLPGVTRPYEGTAQHYAQALWAAGAAPSLLPLIPEAAGELMERLDGLLLSGGVDLHPRFYGEEPHEQLGEVDELRDATEVELYRAARERGLPVLGICRGLQVINVFEGGSLHQHLDGHSQSARGHHYTDTTHDVHFEDGLLARHHPQLTRVNSHHHQAVKAVAPTLRVAARTDDGLVEALEGDGVVCVQWHPEATFHSAPDTNGTFKAYMELFR